MNHLKKQGKDAWWGHEYMSKARSRLTLQVGIGGGEGEIGYGWISKENVMDNCPRPCRGHLSTEVEREVWGSHPPASALNVGVSRGHPGGQGKVVSKADKRLDPSSKWGIKLDLQRHYSSHSYFIDKCELSFTLALRWFSWTREISPQCIENVSTHPCDQLQATITNPSSVASKAGS